MRPQYLVGVIIGVLLIYLGFTGASGIGLRLTWSSATLPTREDFNDLGGWLKYQTGQSISPAGQLLLIAPLTGTDPRSAITSSGALIGITTDYTLVIYMKVDDWSTAGRMNFQLYSSTVHTQFTVTKLGVTALNGVLVPYANNNEWHKYTVVCTGQTKWDLYIGTLKVVTWTEKLTASLESRLSLDAFSGITLHIDWITMESGAHPPDGDPTTVSITIDAAWYDGTTKTALSSVSISVGGVAKTVPATWSSLTKGTVQLVAPASLTRGSDTYTFAHWSDGDEAATRSFDLQSDTSLTAVYSKNGVDPDDDTTPDIFTIIINTIKKILNNSQVMQIELIVGGLVTLVSGVIFVLPTKRYGYAATPQ